MKTLKIILGFILLLGAGMEHGRQFRVFGTFFNPAIITSSFLIILLATWLIASGFSKTKFRIKSIESIKYLIITLLFYIIFVIFGTVKYKPKEFTLEYNNYSVPLSNYIESNKSVIPIYEQRKEFCICITKNLIDNDMIRLIYEKELKTGNIFAIVNDIRDNPVFATIDLTSCFNFIKLEWTESMIESTRNQTKENLMSSYLSETNDIEKLCDCMVDNYIKIPGNELFKNFYIDSEKIDSINSMCIERTAKK